MWLGIPTLARACIYIIAAAMALIGGGLKPRFSGSGALFFLSGGLYIVTALLYPPVPDLVKSDIRNVLVGMAFSSVLALSELTSQSWARLQLRIHRTILVVSTVGALLGLAKLIYYNVGGIVAPLMDADRGYPMGSSLTMDYNFYALPMLLGLLSSFWLMKRDNSPLWCNAALLCVPELICTVLLSGSRRGLITIICAVPVLTAWLMFSRRDCRHGERGSGLSWQAVAGSIFLVAVICVVKLDSLTEFVSDLTSADSFSEVTKRWETFHEGTYSDSRMHYWTITAQRLSRFTSMQYLFGEGFAYVTDLGADPDLVEDYPHNFLLSSLLYGGALQTVCLLTMLGVALACLARPTQHSGMLACWFIIVVIFLATSCNSFFSSEIAVFLTIIGLNVRRFTAPELETHASHAQAVLGVA
jgi:hypothetical protein